MEDYRRLRALTETGRRFAGIGGGFIGSEIAVALALNGKEVVMIFPGTDIGDRVFPRELARYVSAYYQQKGIELRAGEKITGLKMSGSQCVLHTDANREIVVDGVVAGVGIEPNVELAQAVSATSSTIPVCANRPNAGNHMTKRSPRPGRGSTPPPRAAASASV